MRLALIAESQPEPARQAADVVRRLGGRPLMARDGQSALTLARMLQPDVVIVELELPDLDGFELCRRLRTDERTIATPVVLISDLESSTERRRGFRVGANAYLAKPYDDAELSEAVESALAWRADLQRARILGEVELELSSEADLLQDVNEFLTQLCRRTPLTGDQVMHLRQAFLEMGTNAVEWGNRHRPEAMVTITYRVHPDRVEIRVRDEGPGFNPEDVPHAARPDDPLAHLDVRDSLGLRAGGFGLMIARGMLDELRHNARGNEVTLIKRFPQPVAPEAEPALAGAAAHSAARARASEPDSPPCRGPASR